ncbi:MAG TPA: chromate efflux transporter [Anaerolineales bacterium]|jgi:chromate transporter
MQPRPTTTAERAPEAPDPGQDENRLLGLAQVFLKLGLLGFGGPAAHVGMMEDEVVRRRGWLDRDHFLDLVGATNLIPGPNSTEMAIHIGYIHAGLAGWIVAGLCFILPAFLLTTMLGWAYVRYGALPAFEPFLSGIKPAVVTIILVAVLQLGRTAIKGWRMLPIGVLVAGLVLAGWNEVLALLLGGVSGMLWLRWPWRSDPGAGSLAAAFAGLLLAGERSWQWLQQTSDVTLPALGWFFLKIGSVLYGSGYVLVAFLEGGLVNDYGWLTHGQLLDAISAGQLTPGPILSTSAFVGYLLAGVPGAAVAAGAVFLPSFVFVLLLNPIIPRLRQSAWSGAFLDAVNVSAVALIAAVSVRLGVATFTDPVAWLIGLVSLALMLRWNVASSWIVIGGGLAGGALRLLS